MADQKTGFQERRDFFRLNFNAPLEYKVFEAEQKNAGGGRRSAQKAISRNISQSGILFQTEKTPPALSSLVWMNVDVRTLRICQEIEKRALVHEHGLLGRVVRVEEDASNAYDVGVCFVTHDECSKQEVEGILKDITKK